MTSILALMSHDHRECDDSFAAAETAIHNGEMEAAASHWKHFQERVLAHFELEEVSLFPGFEQATGMTVGPTMVMRNEHQHMREMMRHIQEAIEQGDEDAALGQCESLMIFMQQHNMKEEQVLYPMLDQHLSVEEALPVIQDRLAS